MTALIEARDERTFLRLKGQLARLDLLVLDELGYVPASKVGAELLFDVISTAYERTSLIVTTNLPFESWTEVLGSERLTGATLDRLTHRCRIIETKGESYRLPTPRPGPAESSPPCPTPQAASLWTKPKSPSNFKPKCSGFRSARAPVFDQHSQRHADDAKGGDAEGAEREAEAGKQSTGTEASERASQPARRTEGAETEREAGTERKGATSGAGP